MTTQSKLLQLLYGSAFEFNHTDHFYDKSYYGISID